MAEGNELDSQGSEKNQGTNSTAAVKPPNNATTATLKPKESKKDRHMKLVYELSKFLEKANESTVQEVLLLKRTTRETLETVDDNLLKFCASIDVDSYLLDKSERQLISKLNELKSMIKKRADVITQLETDLDQTEMKRSTIVGDELKVLVDKLIAIGYNLPDDIERFVENEAYDVNKDIISNRIEHAKVIAEMRVKHVQLEHELIEKWEKTRVKWRQLRHDQGLQVYMKDITSDYYNHPDDRNQMMEKYRRDQGKRRKNLEAVIAKIMSLSYENITSEIVAEIQQLFQQCNIDELNAIQNCYNQLTDLRKNTDYLCRERVEELRKELHVYGALKIDPKFGPLAKRLEEALNDPNLAELWRLGGGLKPDVQTLVNELTCDDIVYDRVVVSMKEKLDFIQSGFPLKGILEEKGRLASLDKIRGMVTKLRSAPRSEIAGVMKSLLVELEELNRFEGQLAPLFMTTIRSTSEEMKNELEALDKRIAAVAMAGGALDGTLKNSKSATKTLQNAVNTTMMASTLGKTKSKKGGDLKEGTNAVICYVDPMLLKNWQRKLAILFYSSDLPIVYQELCLFINTQVSEQKECNRLVDEVIDQYSTKLLQRMDRVYKKLVDKVTSYLETSANFMFVQTTNLGNFFLKLAKIVELHKSNQKMLDDKAADELWDISEDSRLLLEDLEALYKQTCQKIRESTKQDEIDGHFQEILNILEKIQQEYRGFHQKSCFAADKYPLSLIDEYRSCLMTISTNMFVFPIAHHPIVTEYDRLFDSTERFNRPFFEENPLAAGMERRSYTQQQEFYQVSSTSGGEAHFDSPLGVDRPSDEIAAYGGRYQIIDDQTKIYEHFHTEGKFKVKKENGEHDSDEEAANGEDANKSEGSKTKGAEIDFDCIVIDKPSFEAHPQCCFFQAEATILPVNEEELEVMHPDDREEYENTLLKVFVRFPEGTPYDPNAVPEKKGAKPPPPPDNTGTILGMSPEDQEKYRFLENAAKVARERIRTEASTEYIRDHPPCDKNNQPWANPTEVRFEEIQAMYEEIRQKLITALEMESFKKLLTVEKEMKRKKDELTDQLEDRIRNHWPRRGRVETEIKQPREAELLGHKDKTWRLIQLIQQKMIDLQRRYEEVMQHGNQSCEQYIQEIVSLRNQCNGDFKNLAALQAIDVKARGITLDFQSDCQVKVNTLDKYASVDIESIILFAKDFRKICPKQSPENESGYSESELEEIQVLIDQQCVEMTEVTKMWKERNGQLAEQQTQTLKTYDDFLTKYNKCVQEVAMAEGLGQKYGAPRRRAQERIRTEISKDERRAGKVDEFLAELEFFSSEVGYLPINDTISDGISVHSGHPGHHQTGNNNLEEGSSMSTTTTGSPRHNQKHVKINPTANNIIESCSNLNQLYYTWTIIKALREALIQRVKFLEVINNDPTIPGGGGGFPAPISLPEYPWLNEKRVIDSFLKDLQTSPFVLQKPVSIADENLLPGGQVVTFPTIEAAFLDVDKVCRQETKQLYESEGLASILGPTGVPASLNEWLHESKEKVLGRHGYRERAWKKLWSQMERLDSIFIRVRNISEQGRENFMASSNVGDGPEGGEHSDAQGGHNNNHYESAKESSTTKKGQGTLISSSTKKVSFATAATSSPMKTLTDSTTAMIKKVTMSVQGACIQSYLHSFVLLVKKEWFDQKQYFVKLLHIWQLSREKHERLLRPRLGSPDKADELEQLNQMECTRSLEMVSGVNKFRTSLIRSQMNAFRNFVEDLCNVSKGLLLMLDTIIRQELLLIPPDTEIPKKHMSLKKLRKAQRIREEVARGNSDKSQRRVWPGIEFSEEMIHTIRSSEDMVVDLGQDPKDLTGSDEAPPVVAAPPPDAKKGAKDKKPDKNAPPPVAVPTSPPSLIPTPWMQKMKENSAVEGLVSSAHRIILEERHGAVEKYMQYLHSFFQEVREEYTTILKQEQSWIERWKRQVDMLKQGKV